VYVCGHTDSSGGEEHNLVLSLERAQAVTNVLVDEGVERERIKTQGFGWDYPLAPNDADSGKALNRRTEVILPQ